MPKVSVYNLEGKDIEKLELAPEVFEVAANPGVVHEAVEAQKANARQNLAHTKDRSEVRGGGKKPWRQKGTGRARHGSSRSPIWIGGGITFGPRSERNFAKKINKKVKRKALFMALSDKVKENQFVVLDTLTIPEIKTKKMVTLFKKLPVKTNSALVVVSEKNDTVQKSVRNIPKTKVILADSLNIIDVLKYKYVVVDKAGIEKVVTTFKK